MCELGKPQSRKPSKKRNYTVPDRHPAIYDISLGVMKAESGFSDGISNVYIVPYRTTTLARQARKSCSGFVTVQG